MSADVPNRNSSASDELLQELAVLGDVELEPAGSFPHEVAGASLLSPGGRGEQSVAAIPRERLAAGSSRYSLETHSGGRGTPRTRDIAIEVSRWTC